MGERQLCESSWIFDEVRSGIKDLVDRFIDTPCFFYSEQDMHAYLYHKLISSKLGEPNQQLGYYHRRRGEIRRDFVTTQATALELKQLIDLGYVNRASHRYFPKDAKQSELNDLFRA